MIGGTRAIPMPIQLTEVLAYCQLNQLTKQQAVKLQKRVAAIDAVWLNLESQAAPAVQKKT